MKIFSAVVKLLHANRHGEANLGILETFNWEDKKNKY